MQAKEETPIKDIYEGYLKITGGDKLAASVLTLADAFRNSPAGHADRLITALTSADNRSKGGVPVASAGRTKR